MRRNQLVVLLVVCLSLLVFVTPSVSATGPIGKKTDCYANLEDGGYPASNVCDGNNGNFWQSSTGGFPKYLVTNLTGTKLLSSVAVVLPAFPGSDLLEVDTWDGTGWVTGPNITLANCNSGLATNNTFTFTPARQTSQYRVNYVAQHGCATYVNVAETWPSGGDVPNPPIACALNNIIPGVGFLPLLLTIIGVGVLVLAVTMFFPSAKKGKPNGGNMGTGGIGLSGLVVAIIGIVLIVSVIAVAATQLTGC